MSEPSYAGGGEGGSRHQVGTMEAPAAKVKPSKKVRRVVTKPQRLGSWAWRVLAPPGTHPSRHSHPLPSPTRARRRLRC